MQMPELMFNAFAVISFCWSVWSWNWNRRHRARPKLVFTGRKKAKIDAANPVPCYSYRIENVGDVEARIGEFWVDEFLSHGGHELMPAGDSTNGVSRDLAAASVGHDEAGTCFRYEPVADVSGSAIGSYAPPGNRLRVRYSDRAKHVYETIYVANENHHRNVSEEKIRCLMEPVLVITISWSAPLGLGSFMTGQLFAALLLTAATAALAILLVAPQRDA